MRHASSGPALAGTVQALDGVGFAHRLVRRRVHPRGDSPGFAMALHRHTYDASLRRTDKAVLTLIVAECGASDRCTRSDRWLGDVLGCSRPTIQRAVRRLSNAGAVRRETVSKTENPTGRVLIVTAREAVRGGGGSIKNDRTFDHARSNVRSKMSGQVRSKMIESLVEGGENKRPTSLAGPESPPLAAENEEDGACPLAEDVAQRRRWAAGGAGPLLKAMAVRELAAWGLSFQDDSQEVS